MQIKNESSWKFGQVYTTNWNITNSIITSPAARQQPSHWKPTGVKFFIIFVMICQSSVDSFLNLRSQVVDSPWPSLLKMSAQPNETQTQHFWHIFVLALAVMPEHFVSAEMKVSKLFCSSFISLCRLLVILRPSVMCRDLQHILLELGLTRQSLPSMTTCLHVL